MKATFVSIVLFVLLGLKRQVLLLSTFALILVVFSEQYWAQTSSTPKTMSLSRPHITRPIDDTERVRIPNSAPRVLANALDQGRMPGDMRLEHLILVLKSNPEEEHALSELLDQQQDQTSLNYHRWLTPDEFGRQYGIVPDDLQKITDWLVQHGLTVEDVAHGRRSIMFGATVVDVERVFQTEIHRYVVNGEQHFSNSTDISIPGALSSVVATVASLNDFKPRPTHTVVPRVMVEAQNAYDIKPYYSGFTGNFLTPGDLAVIYNTVPLLSQKITGSGVTIGVIGQSAINLADIQTFQSMFLPAYSVNPVEVRSPYGDPGKPSDDEAEADLDIEIASGVAPNASIIYVAAPTASQAAFYVVDNDLADIISLSYSECETDVGTAFGPLWQQAAAQGITVFVSAGDSGSAGNGLPKQGCDSAKELIAQNGYGVNAYASTPWNVAVGGTEFAENGRDVLYWKSTNGPGFTSALQYIPEVVWNEACSNAGIPAGFGNDCDSGPGIWAGGGGVSKLFSQPSWQIGPGVPAGSFRYLPDVSLTAAKHDGYLICTETVPLFGDCGFQSPTRATVASGVSAATPAFAGIQALINQKTGSRQGQTNYIYYSLAAEQQKNGINCISTTPGGPDSSCIFHDITVGNNGVPCQVTSPDCTTGVLNQFAATPGYDPATGLGSVDAFNLAKAWATATIRSTTTTIPLALINPATRIASIGQPVSFIAVLDVPKGAWGPPPTGGNIAFFDGATKLGVASLSLSVSSDSVDYRATFTTTFPQTGEHIITGQYSGDASGYYTKSTSPSVTITVQQPKTLPTLTGLTINPSTISSRQSATVTAILSGPAPSGGAQIGLSPNPNAFPAPSNFTILPGQNNGTSAPIIAGTVGISTTVNLTGSYNNSSQGATVVINPASTSIISIALTASQASVNPGQTMTLTAMLSGATGPTPTGPLFFYDTFNGVATLLCTQTMSSGSSGGQYMATCLQQFLTTGLHAISVIYDGDTHYGSAISNVADVTVQQQQGSPVLASVTISPSTIVGGFPLLGVLTLTGPAPANAVVTLQSSNPHFVQLPQPQVTVTQGFNTRTFPLTTSFTSGAVGATITGSYNQTTAGASLTVLPVGVSGVTFYPSSVTAGTPAQFTVYLTGPAAAGTSVTLLSSDPSVLQVPDSVALPTGATSVSVTGTTFLVNSQSTATVIATYNLHSAQTVLTVVPAPQVMLNTLVVSPQTVTGGSSATGMIGLTAPAPAGGANVAVSSSSNLVQSATVAVPSGSVFAPFTLATSPVNSVTNVNLAASYGGASQDVVLTLVPPLPFVAALSFSPSTVESGSSTTGTVTLTAPAPLGGVLVNLSSNSVSSVVNVSGVIVQAGSTTGTFTLHTSPIGFIAPVTIVASYNGTSASTMLTIVPPGTPLAPSALILNPSSIIGGTLSTGTILLTGPAPANGALLSIASDNPAVPVPPTVNVPSGANSTVFAVSTASVSSVSTATITISYNGIAQSSLLTLKPSVAPPSANPVPFLAAPLAPVSHPPDPTGFTFTANGSGFVPGAQILWDGTTLPTTFVSSGKLQASNPGVGINQSAVVTVKNPGPINAASNNLVEHLSYARQALSFANASLSLSGEPSAIAIGDFNRDGNADVVVGKADGSGLSVFLGNGDGTFGPELILPAKFAFATVVGDFNGDGKPDIVSIAGTRIRVFLGNGDGSFTSLPEIQLPSGVGNPSLTTGDFNGDGSLDLVVTGSAQAYVLLGNGDGTFGAPSGFGNLNQPSSVVVADFDGDGKLDLALPNLPNKTIAVLLGNGDGTFQVQKEYPSNGFAIALAVADFDGDGHPDIAVANQGPCCGSEGGLAVLHNKGDGTFASPVTYGAGQAFYSIAIDDMNGDGNLDLLLIANINPNHHLWTFLGDGSGGFSPTPVVLPLGTSPTLATVADLNNDGAPDVLVPNSQNNGGVFVLLQSIGPVLHVSPPNLSFATIEGGAAPSPLPLTVSNTGGGTEQWAATASQPWVTLSQTSGSAPSSTNVGVNPSGLAPGAYSANITITATSAANSPQTVPVSLSVNVPPIVISSLTTKPTAVSGGTTATGTVNLSGVASQRAAVISLVSDTSSAQAPATVAIPVGSSSTTFQVATSMVTNQTIATITATYSGVSTSATLTVNPLLALLVTKQGTGSGTVTSDDGSISCGVTCLANFNSGTTVTLTAAPASGSVFTGWGGACSGTQLCSVTMNAAQTVSATFTQIQPGALLFVPVTPCRVVDTRNPAGSFGGPFLTGGSTRGFTIPNSACGIPSTAQAYSINVTVVPKAKLAFLTMFPCGQNLPLVSTLNSDGRIKAAAAIVPAGTNGAVCAFTTDDTEFILDIDGYFVPATDTSALAFYPVTPCRLVDTRLTTGTLGGPSLVGNTTRTFPLLASPCNVPPIAKAYSLNFTSVPKGKLGFLTTWPAGQTQPLVSTLNAPTGTITANAAIVPAGTNGDISVFVTNGSDLVIDINGYFAPPGPDGGALFNLVPCRVLDTRNPVGTPPLSGTLNINVPASGCGAPASAQAYVLNATVVPPGPLGFLTLWPQGAAQPLVSTLNAVDGAITSNMAIVPATNGSIIAFPQDPTHLVLDISGYFAAPLASPTEIVTRSTRTPVLDGPHTYQQPISTDFHNQLNLIRNKACLFCEFSNPNSH